MSRAFRHVTPRYVYDRLALMVEQRRNPTDPWLTADAIGILKQVLKPTDVGAEFGSGRSTIWFANRIRHLTSVEQDPEWFGRVSGMIEEQGLSAKVSYHLAIDEASYAGHAQKIADESIDFCLVDGDVRDLCADAILPKLKPGGVFVIDNVNQFIPNAWTTSPQTLRSGYPSDTWARVADILSGWRGVWTSNGVWDTAIWFKP